MIVHENAHALGIWTYELWRPKKSGKLFLVAEDIWKNIIVTTGRNYLLSIGLAGGTQITAWYVMLKGTGTAVAADTLASHGSWSEINPYTGNRPAWTAGSVSAGAVDNSAAKASYAITSNTTVYGAALASANSGTTGTLYAAGDFTAPRAVLSGDTLNVTGAFSLADDGV